jgi:hypothetical protein
LLADENHVEGAAVAAPTPEPRTGAFDKDKKFGNRLDQVVAIGEPFLLLGAIADEPIETAYGLSNTAKLLIQKINKETGAPQGAPIRAVTVLSAVVEKVLALTPEELAAGPVVQLQVVAAKSRGGKHATVLSWMRNLADEDDFSEFGLDANTVSQRADLARSAGERIPY